MATKIRLQRRGRKGYAYYHIVIADSRAPRDGRFIERIGSYNPNTDPSSVSLNMERALYWVMTGAQPTDTVRNILSNEGVLLKKHLAVGVRKGAITEAQAEERFNAWKAEKDAKTLKLVEENNSKKADALRARLEAEKAKNKEKMELLAKKRAEQLAAEEAAAKEALEAEQAPAAE